MKRLRMKEHGTDGLLITVCGLDGCGKSTMIHKLKDWLVVNGREVFLTKQPTDLVRQSDMFRTYMDHVDHTGYDYRSLSLLAASDRVQHANRVIMPALQNGNVVISDRYLYSCLANLRARGYEKDRWIYEIARAIPKPDIAFFLDLPVSIALGRVRERPEEKDRYIDLDLQYRLRNEYLDICRQNGGICLSSREDAEQTFANMKRYIEQIWEENDYE